MYKEIVHALLCIQQYILGADSTISQANYHIFSIFQIIVAFNPISLQKLH